MRGAEDSLEARKAHCWEDCKTSGGLGPQVQEGNEARVLNESLESHAKACTLHSAGSGGPREEEPRRTCSPIVEGGGIWQQKMVRRAPLMYSLPPAL